jgi:tRNA A-37 threonylcarbamoyl transferase component Bud32
MLGNRDETQPYFPSVDASDEPTIRLPPSMTHGGGEASPAEERAHVKLVAGTGPHLSTVTQSLRLRRLRAAALFLIAMQGLLLTWRVAIGGGGLWQLNVAMILGLGAAAGFLQGEGPISARRIKGVEAALFGLMVVYLALRQYHLIVHEQDSPADLLAVGRGSMILAILLMFVYTKFVPNDWRGTARVVIPIALVPASTTVLASLIHPEVFRRVHDAVSLSSISENVLFMAVASILAIYGAHVQNTLRTEAFEARQLNQYRLVKRLGSGGMGEVFLAEHHMMKRPCALKRIRADKAGDPATLARFEREVRATSRLSHPNTIEIYDFGRADDGTFYYVMEYLPGMSLADIVEKHSPMPFGRAIYLLRQACGALAEAHASGLIHRDLKPANIFAARRGGRWDVAKVLDFGLVKDREAEASDPRLSREHTVQGTPTYMAPEQVLGRPDMDHRIDIYALGCVAYTVLTGRPPFDEASGVAVMVAHAKTPAEPPSKHRPGLPEDLEQVVLRCLEKSPDDRYPDAIALERALASCASASEWNVGEAQRWWRDFEPGRQADDSPLEPRAARPAPAPVA